MSAFEQYFKETLTERYADFEGRARRSEYWFFVLFSYISIIVVSVVFGILGSMVSEVVGMIGLVGVMLALFVPQLAVYVRRLHDTGKSGWWILFGLVPLVGSIVLLVFLCTDSTPGSNQYGPNPKELQENDLVGNLVE